MAKLYSNYVRKVNATELDNETQVEDVISIVKEALKNGVKEIYFEYREGGLESDSNPQATNECETV